MATLSLSAISVAMSLMLQDDFAHQTPRTSVLLGVLRVVPGRNSALTWNPKFNTRATAGPYAEGADMADGDYDSDTPVQAALSWSNYRAGAKVSGLAEAVAAAGGYVGGASAMAVEVNDGLGELLKAISEDLYDGDPAASPTELAGAAIAIDSDTGSTFAGVDPATYGDWTSGENSVASADLSKQKIRELLFRPVKDAKKRLPDFVTCPGDVFDTLLGIVGEEAMTDTIYINGSEVNARQVAGARAMTIDGVPILEDEDCTASTLYAWTWADVELHQVAAADVAQQQSGILGFQVSLDQVVEAMRMLTGIEDIGLDDVKARLQQRVGRLLPVIQVLAPTGDAYKVMIKAYLQVKWRSRNGFAKLTLT
jgi:hypothetical protein